MPGIACGCRPEACTGLGPIPCSNTVMIRVVAAILERDDRVLICRRKADQSHPLKWEFPGGKVEAGETAEQALTRELEEELDVRDAVGDEIRRYEFCYPGKKPIELIFFRVRTFAGEPRNVVFHEMCWETPARLREYDFVEGDTEFLRTYTGSYGIPDSEDRSGPK
jgi:8-oxo-dGTP diphosphatase